MNRNTVLISLLVFLCAVVWAGLLFDPLLHTGGDNGRYLMLAKSIKQGDFMREINSPMKRFHAQYPPIFPLILSGAMSLFGDENIIAFKILSLLFFSFSVPLFFLLSLRCGFDKRLSLFLTFFYLFNFNSVQWSSYILTESLFSLLFILSLILFIIFHQTGKNMHLILCLVAFSLSTLTKSIGVFLFPSLFVYLLLVKSKAKNLATTAVFFILSQSWSLYAFFASSGGDTYFRQILYKNWYLPHLGYLDFSSLISRITENLFAYFVFIFPTSFFAFMGKIWYMYPIPIIVFVWLTYSLLKSLKESSGKFIGSLLALNILMLIFWPQVFTTERFIVHLIPLMLLISGVTLRDLKKNIAVKSVYFFLTACLISNIAYGAMKMPERIDMKKRADINFRKNIDLYPDDFSALFSIADYARKNTPDTAVFVSVKPELFYLFSERRTVIFPYTRNADKISNFFAEMGIDYVVYHNTDSPRSIAYGTINPFFRENIGRFTHIVHDPEKPYYALFEVVIPF